VKHQRAPQHGRRHAGGLGGGVGHHALERALADAARQERAQERLLARGGAPEQLGQRLAPGRLRAGAAEPADARERGVDLHQLERRLERRRRQVLDRRPADPDLALPQLAGQERDRDRRLPRRRGAQRLGERGDLAAAGAGGGDGLRGGDELVEEHAANARVRG
jgi:hypothetical protein